MENTINKQHPRIKNRSFKHQEYRDDLANNLRDKRSQ